MDEPNNPNRALLDAQDWGDIYARLVVFAEHRARSAALGKDLAQEAITRVFANAAKWNPKKDPDLVRYLMSVVNSLLANQRTSAASRRTSSMELKRVARKVAKVGDAQAFSEEKMENTDLFQRRMTLLLERAAGDPYVVCLLELMVKGIETPAKIREATHWSAAETMATQKRMLRLAAGVARDIGGPPEDDLPRSLGEDDDGEEVG